MARVLGLGDNTVDIYVDHGVQFPGGNAVNVAVLARRLGAEAAYLGCTGNDELGALVRDSLAAEGVDISRTRRIDGPNPFSRIKHAGNDRVFAGSRPGVRGQFGFQPDDFAYIAGFDLVHTSVYSELDGMLATIRPHARLLSYDYSEHWDRPAARTTFAHVDLVFLSAPRLDETALRALLAEIAARGPKLVVATRGVAGSLALAAGRFHAEGIRPATVVDTLGAGDGLIAGFLVNWLALRDVASALARGAEHAARVCEQRGAWGHETPVRPGQAGLEIPVSAPA